MTTAVSDTNGSTTKTKNGTAKTENGLDDHDDSEDDDKDAGEGVAVDGGVYIFHFPKKALTSRQKRRRKRESPGRRRRRVPQRAMAPLEQRNKVLLLASRCLTSFPMANTRMAKKSST